ncbi:3'(2'),5'-bisphosphate nucleotidase CysQ family protein [Oxynema aestuarii]|jgi:3'(2'), 5'-bisphosphate nucleotidase|uniref:inositol-phosphate phosphatase n=1 Tax=Oxynema aestuarii AP17 TaxID=2064643 RepID=A0A6H1TZ31_9CYAN|nr:3'(2'),5'-bisphosphate nucleotidase CysQ [Oxynema aestuarii]QIZ71844.1 3'(2'),5'-bisphosphate nucleotidase CysQ [Oxynema aestuarii AP17]RMH76690.1 MAG: 3'(2'),5'-bisphosphate nucleotidase CysQ [Cyanobacteria bacterium J007]
MSNPPSIASTAARIDGRDLNRLGAIAREIAWGAADILVPHHGNATGGLRVRHQADGPVTSADLAASHYILQQLRVAVGSQDYAFVSEETYKLDPDSRDRCRHDWVWIIDPIDGTRSFIHGDPNYAIHIALAYRGRPAVAVVAIPAADKLYYAHLGGGAFLETRDGQQTRVRVSPRDRLQELCVVTRRSDRDSRLYQLLAHLPCRHRPQLGSIGCKMAALIEGNGDAYISLSGRTAPKDWDLAAPELILTEAGGRCTYLDGTPLQYNRADISQWGCAIASTGGCHDALRSAIARGLSEIDRRRSQIGSR